MTVLKIHKENIEVLNNAHGQQGQFEKEVPCVQEQSLALAYHAYPVPGKYATVPIKKLSDASDLALAYSPGVAEACRIIAEHPASAQQYTMRQHLVAVISNGTAVLGLGNIGPLASKPVMEGKAVLFQLFSGLNAIDLEINEQNPEKLVDIIASLAPSFGAINLEDIKAPECFYIESALQERLDIPVFHDDQHGTAITVSASMINALELVGKTLENSRCVVAGAGAGALACVQLLIQLGMQPGHITVCDTKGVIHSGRQDLSEIKKKYALDTEHRTLKDALKGADIFLGLSGPETVTADMIKEMAEKPIVFALANPIPEIWPHSVLAVRPDAFVGTGRSDLPNQINNVLCFPYIFRGAMDVGAQTITLAMKKACVSALSGLAKRGFVDFKGKDQKEIHNFGPNYFIPKPFDLRLGVDLPLAVARAALDSTQNHAFDLDHYRACLIQRAYRDFFIFKHVYSHSSGRTNLPTLGYRIETQDGRIPHSVMAAARTLKECAVAQPYFIGLKPHLLEQLSLDPILSQCPVYDITAWDAIGFYTGEGTHRDNNGMHGVQDLHAGPPNHGAIQEQNSGPMVRVVSHARVMTSYVQGWMHQGAMHFYALKKPCAVMVGMLKKLGCIFQDQADDMESNFFHKRVIGHPHFGGLSANPQIPAHWHCSVVPEILAPRDSCFGPIDIDMHGVFEIGERDSMHHALEKSSWAILMQEKTP